MKSLFGILLVILLWTSCSDHEKDVHSAGEAGSEPSPQAPCPPGMSLIPGDDSVKGDEEARGRGGFCMDRFEYPNQEGVTPMRRASWTKARKLCRNQGKRLCSVAEWERACRGPDDLLFPYGAEYDPEACRTDLAWGNEPVASGASKDCVNGYGVWDMVGNLWEWTDGERSGEKGQKILKGGSWASRGEQFASCSAEISNYTGIKLGFYGFRCCRDPRNRGR